MINPIAIIRNVLSTNNINNQNSDNISITDIDREEVINDEQVTPEELNAWYLLNMAIEPCRVVGITVLTPLILERYAGRTGFKTIDINIKCDVDEPNYNCITKFGNGYVNTESYSFYVIAISVVLQVFVFICCGALADYGKLNWLAATFTVIIHLCYGSVNVFLLAYIPFYSQHLPNVIEAKNDPNNDYHEIEALIEYNSNKLSTNALGTGVATGIVFLAIYAAIADFMEDLLLSLRIGCLIIGTSCLFLSTFSLLWLKNRSGPPLPRNENIFLFSIKRIFTTLSEAQELWQTMKFLLVWFMMSDGFNTIVTVTVIFGRKEFNMLSAELLAAALLVPLMAIVGAYLFFFIQQKLKLSTKTMVLIVCGLEALLPFYGLCGFFAPFGLKEKWEFWFFAVFFGLMIGAAQSFSRVLFTSLIPKGHENEFFSLYEITDKGSSWIGTLLIGIINDATSDLRYSYLVLALIIALPLLLIATIDVEKGKVDAENFSKKRTQ